MKHKTRPDPAALIKEACVQVFKQPPLAGPVLNGIADFLTATAEGRALLHASSETAAEIVKGLTPPEPDGAPGKPTIEIYTAACVAVYTNLILFGYRAATMPPKGINQ